MLAGAAVTGEAKVVREVIGEVGIRSWLSVAFLEDRFEDAGEGFVVSRVA